MPMNNPLIRSVRQGIERAHVETGSQQRVRRPLTWGMLRGVQRSIASWGEGGRVLWISLALSFFFMLRTSELLAKERSVYHKVYCLNRVDVACFRDNDQLAEGSIPEANKVEVSFRGSKGDQERK